MKKFSVESKIVVGFVTAVVVLLLAGGQLYRTLNEYRDTSRWIAHTHLVLDAIDDVRIGMTELVIEHLLQAARVETPRIDYSGARFVPTRSVVQSGS